jgi:toxin ParE1/3/4
VKITKPTKIIWTHPAKFQLKEIYIYHKKVASVKVAKSIKNKIIEITKSLASFKQIGQEEELLKSKKEEYRYLVEGNYKIIYKPATDIIYIMDVFDTRQNPDKLPKRV